MKRYCIFCLVVVVLLGGCRKEKEINTTPQLYDQEFEVWENSASGTSVGRVVALDPDDDPLVYSLLSQQPATAFGIDATTGELYVDKSELLDFEKIQHFTLQVQVQDQGRKSSRSVQATIVINIKNVREQVFLYLPDTPADVDDDLVCSNLFLYHNSENHPVILAVKSDYQGEVFHVRSFLHFNKWALPENAAIQNATLTLYCNSTATDFSRKNLLIQLLALDGPWQEGKISWGHHPAGLEQSVLDIVILDEIWDDFDKPMAMQFDVTQLVQTAIAETGSFYGFMLKLKYESYSQFPMEVVSFSSSDDPTAAYRPSLSITYLE